MNERRANYDSGYDFVLEYGEIRATFNRKDFRQRLDFAIKHLDLVYPDYQLNDAEIEDLENLIVNGEIGDDALSDLGDHLAAIIFSEKQNGLAEEEGSIVHWLRRIVFREAWLDQRLSDGEIDVIFDEDINDFVRVYDDNREPVVFKTRSWSLNVYDPN